MYWFWLPDLTADSWNVSVDRHSQLRKYIIDFGIKSASISPAPHVHVNTQPVTQLMV